MKIKRIKSIKINSYEFKIKWDKESSGGYFSYRDNIINIGVKNNSDNEIFMIVCHELMEIVCMEMHVRFDRPDCNSDYLFVYDHRQHDTITNMLSSLLTQFIR